MRARKILKWESTGLVSPLLASDTCYATKNFAEFAAMAAAIKQVRLTSAIALMATADPFRTFRDFAAANLVEWANRGLYSRPAPLSAIRLQV
jgi:hypothetical protein